MRGSDQNMGAVAGLRRVKDATKVARDVMELTEHSMLAGELATEFAVKLGYTKESLTGEYSRQLYQDWVKNGCVPNFYTDGRGCNGTIVVAEGSTTTQNPSPRIDEHNHDTIGQIALQADGRMAIGMSSNGARHKIAGRIGDAPLPGAGGYVDNEVGACVATGDGDVMMRHLPAFLGVELMRGGLGPQAAANEAVRRISKKHSGFSGAVVCVNTGGEHAAACEGFQEFSYSVQSEGGSEADVKVIKVRSLSLLVMSDAQQKLILDS